MAGGFFVISTILGSASHLLAVSALEGSTKTLWALLLADSGLFAAGIIFLGLALLVDYIQIDLSFLSVNMPERDGERPKTEPVDEEDSD